MPIKSKANLTIGNNNAITDALNKQNTAARVRNDIQDVIDSSLNVLDVLSGSVSIANLYVSTLNGVVPDGDITLSDVLDNDSDLNGRKITGTMSVDNTFSNIYEPFLEVNSTLMPSTFSMASSTSAYVPYGTSSAVLLSLDGMGISFNNFVATQSVNNIQTINLGDVDFPQMVISDNSIAITKDTTITRKLNVSRVNIGSNTLNSFTNLATGVFNTVSGFYIAVNGKNNIVGGSYSLVGGESNNIFSYNNIIGGDHHKSYSSDSAMMYGSNNTLTQSGWNFLGGLSNYLNNSQYNIVNGENIVMTSSYYSNVSGYGHQVLSSVNNNISGDSHKITNTTIFNAGSNNISGVSHKINDVSSSNNISGDTNTISDSNSNNISGQLNIIDETSYSNISGAGHNISNFCDYSIVGGNTHTIDDGGSNIIGGDNITINSAANSIIGGSNHNITNSGSNLIAGSNHTINGVDYSRIDGRQNTASNDYVDVSGRFVTTSTIGEYARNFTQIYSQYKSQYGTIQLSIQTTNSTKTRLTISLGSSDLFNIPINSSYQLNCRVLGTTQTTGDSVSFEIKDIIKNVAGTTSMVTGAAPVQISTDASLAGTTISLEADDATDSLSLSVFGVTATNIYWHAVVDYVKTVFV